MAFTELFAKVLIKDPGPVNDQGSLSSSAFISVTKVINIAKVKDDELTRMYMYYEETPDEHLDIQEGIKRLIIDKS